LTTEKLNAVPEKRIFHETLQEKLKQRSSFKCAKKIKKKNELRR